MNHNYKLEKKKKQSHESSDLTINCDIDYMSITRTNHYHEIYEAITELGGMKAILQPMIDNLTPIFTVIFLIKLMKVIKQSQIDEYFVELKNTISKAYEDL